jgi:hypothetical protein
MVVRRPLDKKELTKSELPPPFFSETVEKSRIYLAPGESPPHGVAPHKGPKGGLYYDTDDVGSPGEEEPTSSINRLLDLEPKIGNPKFNIAVGDLGERIATSIPLLQNHHLTQYSDMPKEISSKYNVSTDGRNAPVDMLNGTSVEIKVSRHARVTMWKNQVEKKKSFCEEMKRPLKAIIMLHPHDDVIDVYAHSFISRQPL